MFVVFLAPIMLNVVDLGFYIFQRMQVENAAQAGAQAAWANCAVSPASQAACGNLVNAVDNAVHSTLLGTSVTWTNKNQTWALSNPDVTTYCPSATNSLAASSVALCPATNATAGTYAKVSVSYPYRPVFPGATVASLLPTPITATTYSRLF